MPLFFFKWKEFTAAAIAENQATSSHAIYRHCNAAVLAGICRYITIEPRYRRCIRPQALVAVMAGIAGCAVPQEAIMAGGRTAHHKAQPSSPPDRQGAQQRR